MSEVDDQAARLARHFHECHEPLHAAARHRQVTPWAEMPESYRRRLQLTFAGMLRSGIVAPGPMFVALNAA